jgi:iron complex outermembrane receptor protein
MSHRPSRRSAWLAGVALVGVAAPSAVVLGGAAVAQQSTEVITVTAQRRAQDVQDVPIAISVFTSTALEERGVAEVAQLSGIAPNVTLDGGTPFSGSSSVLSAYIRGIGQNDFAFNLDPGVGVYLDGVYLARTVGANQDLLDVERIEVLKGPQGTLFGRNTIGGAVSIVTRDPGDEFGGEIDVTTGSFERMRVRGTVDIPLSDSVKSALSFSMQDRDGYMERIPFPTDEPFFAEPFTAYRHAGYSSSEEEGGDNSWSARYKVAFDNGGPLRATFAADMTNVDQTQLANSILATTPIPGPFAGLAENNIPGTALDVVTGSSGFLFAGLYNFCIGATPGQIAARNAQNLCGVRGTTLNPSLMLPPLAGVNVDGDPFNDRLPYDDRFLTSDIDESYATGNSYTETESWGLALTLDYDLGDGMALKSITSYRDLYWNVGMDLDGSPLNILQTSFITDQRQASQELQLTGTLFEDAIDYVVGLYYFKEEGHLHDFVTFSEGLLQIDGNNELSTENYAAFGQFDWRINDLVTLQVGGRFTSEEKTFEGFQSDLNGFNYKLFNDVDFSPAGVTRNGFPNPDQPLRYYPAGEQEKSFDNFSPRVGVQLFPMDDVMVYGTWSQGYKTGGWTTRLSNPLPEAPDFDEEEAESFEVGVKSRLFDNLLQLNAAVFQTTYDGIQLNFQEGVSPTIRNAGEAEIRGAEVETVWNLTDAFTVNATLGLLDTEYTDVLPQAVAGAPPIPGVQEGIGEGVSLPKAPEVQFNITPSYTAQLPGGRGELQFVADFTYTSDLKNDTQGTYLLVRDDTNILNASVTWRPENANWEVSFGGTNLTDERYLVTGQAQIAGGNIQGTYSRPAEWFATLRARF